MKLALLIFLLLFGVGVTVVFIGIYNALVALRSQLERAWANIDVILKQRFDEIPQLILVVEQYAGYEADILKQLSDSRSRYGTAKSREEKMSAASEFQVALNGIAALGEAYPDLKANQNFIQLQERVSALEETLADRRETYNECVANFNTRIEQFPDVFAARLKMNLPHMKQ